MIAQSLVPKSLLPLAILLAAWPCAAETLRLDSGFTLSSAERRYVLSGIVPPYGDPAQQREAAAWLKARLEHHDWALKSYGAPDRYGRMALSARDETGDDLAEAMLRAGEALADSAVPEEPRLSYLMAAEDAARRSNRGWWAHPPVYPVEAAAPAIGRYALLQGVVTQVSSGKSGLYLDFGADWKKASSAWVPAHFKGRFPDGWAQTLLHRKIELRGWVEAKNGDPAPGAVRIVLLSPAAVTVLP